MRFLKLSSLSRNAGLIVLAALVVVLGYAFVQRMFVRPPVEPRLVHDTEQAKREVVIQLRILNATTAQGIARQATDYLRQRGFDVVLSENAQARDESAIVCLRGDTLAAHQLAYAVGLEKSRVTTEIDSSLVLDCSLILGSDYKKLRIFQ